MLIGSQFGCHVTNKWRCCHPARFFWETLGRVHSCGYHFTCNNQRYPSAWRRWSLMAAGWWSLPYHQNCLGTTRSQSEQSLRCVGKVRSMEPHLTACRTQRICHPCPGPPRTGLFQHLIGCLICGGETDTMSTLSCSSNHPRVKIRG